MPLAGSWCDQFSSRRELRKERAAAAAVADLFVQACQSGNVATFYQAVDQTNLTFDGWKVAMRRFAGKVRSVSPEIESAFFHVWIKSKMLPFLVNDHRALCNAARVLFPRYPGAICPPVSRRVGAVERRHRTYGMSWSADLTVADRFARKRQVWDGGSATLTMSSRSRLPGMSRRTPSFSASPSSRLACPTRVA